MEVINREVEVGRYRIDILAKDAYTDEKIIIENQLNYSDHDHLGKIITYASGLDAKYIVWIVKDAREEHLKAVQWLNENLEDHICIFLIKIELWQIDNSKPAPSFEVLVKKNNWVENLKDRNSLSGRQRYVLSHGEHYDFWVKFTEYLDKTKFSHTSQNPKPKHWLSFSIGSSFGHVSALLNKSKNLVGVDFVISNNKDFFAFVKKYLDSNPSPYGSDITYYDATKMSGFRVFKNIEDVFSSSYEIESFEWLRDNVKITIDLYNQLLDEYNKIETQ
jgi:hypothetical protein